MFQPVASYTVLFERGPRNWSAFVPDLPGCIATGKDRRTVERRIREAIRLHLEDIRASGVRPPAPTVVAGVVGVE